MASSSSVYLVNIDGLDFDTLRVQILNRVRDDLQRIPTYLSAHEQAERREQLAGLKQAAQAATDLPTLARGLDDWGTLVNVAGLWFLRESRYACDQLSDQQGRVLEVVLRDRLQSITEVHY